MEPGAGINAYWTSAVNRLFGVPSAGTSPSIFSSATFTVSRERLTELHQERHGLQGDLRKLKQSYLAADRKVPTFDECFVINCRATESSPSSPWLHTHEGVWASEPHAPYVDAWFDQHLVTPPRGHPYWAVAARSHEAQRRSVVRARRAWLKLVIREVRRKLRTVVGEIRLLSSSLRHPDHPHCIATKERPWFLLHGARPPRLLSLAARAINRLIDRPRAPKLSGAFAA
jgi:hypothetical protein